MKKEKGKRITKRAEFLEKMDAIIPWRMWIELIAPYYPDGKRGRPVKGIERMLRMYLLQTWFDLSDERAEDELSDSISMRKFARMEEGEEAPDATTLLKFRHLLEEHELNRVIFEAQNRILEETGHMLRGGTIVDATIIPAPSSTKNQEKKRDGEMRSTKKNNNFFFGMKAHIGADAFSGLVHSLRVTPANVPDVEMAAELLREDDKVMWGDNGYQGIAKRPEIMGSEILSKIDFRVNCRRSSLPKVSEKAMDWNRHMEYLKSSVRSKVEFPFRIVKRIFGFRKTAYRGLKKNENRLYMLFACSNLYMLAGAGRTLSPAW